MNSILYLRLIVALAFTIALSASAQTSKKSQKPSSEIMEFRRTFPCADQCTQFAIRDGKDPEVWTLICFTDFSTCNGVVPGLIRVTRIPMNQECTAVRSLYLALYTANKPNGKALAEDMLQHDKVCVELETRPYPLVYYLQNVRVMTATEAEQWRKSKQ
jgi:hypothetical protein